LGDLLRQRLVVRRISVPVIYDLDSVLAELSQAALERRMAVETRFAATQGTATIGIRRPVYSQSSPTASVSVMPSAHLLSVLKVAGKATTASARGRTSGSSGCLY
jgi:hypothetical protein